MSLSSFSAYIMSPSEPSRLLVMCSLLLISTPFEAFNIHVENPDDDAFFILAVSLHFVLQSFLRIALDYGPPNIRSTQSTAKAALTITTCQ